MNSTSKVLAKRRELYDAQDSLDLRKMQYSKEDNALKLLESSLTSEDIVLQQELIQFTKLLDENESTRKRAETSCNDELVIQTEISEEIDELQRKLEAFRSREGDLLFEIDSYRVYEKYLSDVLRRNDEFKDVEDIIDRFKSLARANAELQAKLVECDRRNIKTRLELDLYNKDAANTSLTLNNDATTLSYDQDTVKKAFQSLQEESDALSHQETVDAQIVGQINRSVDNILTRVINNRGTVQHITLAALPSSTISQKLSALAGLLADLSNVADVCQKERRQQMVSPVVKPAVAENQAIPEFFRPKLKTQPSFSSKTQSMGVTNN